MSNLIVVNPSSDKGKALKKIKIIENLLRKYRIEYELLISSSLSNFREIIRERAKNFKTLTIGGGDSSFTIAVDEIVKSKTDIPLNFIPLGSSNDFSIELNRRTIEEAVLKLKSKVYEKRSVGLLKINHFEHYFFGQVNLGIGAYVNSFVRRHRLKFLSDNILGFFGVISYFKRKESNYFEIKADKNEISGFFDIVLISNIEYWAGGIKIFKKKNFNNKFSIFILKKGNFWGLKKVNDLLQRGEKPDNSIFLTAKKIIISSYTKFTTQMDGELFSAKRNNNNKYSVELDHKKDLVTIIK